MYVCDISVYMCGSGIGGYEICMCGMCTVCACMWRVLLCMVWSVVG